MKIWSFLLVFMLLIVSVSAMPSAENSRVAWTRTSEVQPEIEQKVDLSANFERTRNNNPSITIEEKAPRTATAAEVATKSHFEEENLKDYFPDFESDEKLDFPLIAYYGNGPNLKFVFFEKRQVDLENLQRINREYKGRLLIAETSLPEEDFDLEGTDFEKLIVKPRPVEGKPTSVGLEGSANFDFVDNILTLKIHDQELNFVINEVERNPIREEGVDAKEVVQNEEVTSDLQKEEVSEAIEKREKKEEKVEKEQIVIEEETVNEETVADNELVPPRFFPGAWDWFKTRILGITQ